MGYVQGVGTCPAGGLDECFRRTSQTLCRTWPARSLCVIRIAPISMVSIAAYDLYRGRTKHPISVSPVSQSYSLPIHTEKEKEREKERERETATATATETETETHTLNTNRWMRCSELCYGPIGGLEGRRGSLRTPLACSNNNVATNVEHTSAYYD